MQPASPRSGYTLPVFACAAAIAALRHLHTMEPLVNVELDLVKPAEMVTIPIEQVAMLKPGMALAITRSDPGDNLDLTRDTPIWAVVEAGQPDQTEPIQIMGGTGIGRHQADGEAAIYRYANQLLQTNLSRWLQPAETIQVTIILPEGKALAERTSNAAFGIVEGLSLLGTTGISEPLSAPGQLAAYRQTLQQKIERYDCLVFCIGENGLNFAEKLGVSPDRLLKTANWLGPLLAEAGVQGARSILLFGYHGKLIKLAGGIFHTHTHVADGRLEILTAHGANMGLPTPTLQTIFTSPTAEAGLNVLQALDAQTGSDWVKRVYGAIAHTIDQRTQTYIHAHSGRNVTIGTILFNRQRQIIAQTTTGANLLEKVLLG